MNGVVILIEKPAQGMNSKQCCNAEVLYALISRLEQKMAMILCLMAKASEQQRDGCGSNCRVLNPEAEIKISGNSAFLDIEYESIEPLSIREQEVLDLIGRGYSNSAVADKLYISTATVKTHTRNIYGKLNSHSRTEAVAKARAYGILVN